MFSPSAWHAGGRSCISAGFERFEEWATEETSCRQSHSGSFDVFRDFVAPDAPPPARRPRDEPVRPTVSGGNAAVRSAGDVLYLQRAAGNAAVATVLGGRLGAGPARTTDAGVVQRSDGDAKEGTTAPATSTVPTPGSLYQIRIGDSLLGVAGQAYGVGPGSERLQMAKLINDDPSNARFHTADLPNSELAMFGGPRISFSPRFADPAAQLEGDDRPGHHFAVIRIPSKTPEPAAVIEAIDAPLALVPPAVVPVRAQSSDSAPIMETPIVWRVVVAADGSDTPAARVIKAAKNGVAFLQVDEAAESVEAVELQAATDPASFVSPQPGAEVARRIVRLAPAGANIDHFDPLAAHATAVMYIKAFQLKSIVLGDGSGLPKWTNPQLDLLMKCLSEDTAPKHHAVFSNLMIIKNHLSGDEKGEFKTVDGDSEMTIDPRPFADDWFFRMVVQHEIGHGTVQKRTAPGIVGQLGKFLRKKGDLRSEANIKVMFGPFANQAIEDLAENPRAPEEYYCTAYATWRVSPERLIPQLKTFLDKRLS